MNEKPSYKEMNNQLTTPYSDLRIKLNDIPLNQYSGTGKAQNIIEYGFANFPNNGLDLDNNDNASIIVPEDWKANEVLVNISSIFDYNTFWVNETFDTGIDSSYWTDYTDRPQNVTFGLYNNTVGDNDSIYIKFKGNGTSWVDIDSYVSYTFNLPRKHIPYQYWDLNYNFWANYSEETWLPGTGGANYYCKLYVNGVFAEFSRKLTDLNNNTVSSDTIPLFNPEQYNMVLPGTITLQLGVYFGQTAINPSGFFQMFFDNITLSLSTIPKPSQINLNIIDITNGFVETKINDIDYGKGTITLQNIWSGALDGATHYFVFNSNSSGSNELNSDFFVKATSQKKTNTQLGSIGAEFQIENDTKTTWTMYSTMIIPGTYTTDYYMNITKPINWNVTHLIDPYGANRINDVLATAGYGNSTIMIPNGIVTNGIWKIVAKAPNYVEEANIFRKSTSIWKQNKTFYSFDKLKINGTIRTSLIPDIDKTNVSLKIYYSNETLWYQEEKISIDSSGTFEFSETTLGSNNITSGKYLAQIIWNDHDLNMSQVGIKLLEFKVIHKTNLTAINSYFERMAGEPLLLKVKFIDSDLNKSIAYATITYNSTYGSSGTMVYEGSGVYISEIDTNSLDLGDYYFSFNASKNYYENQIANNLIHLKIVAQPLALEVPSTVINGMGNDYISCQINVTGAISGELIAAANISTNWINPYTVTDHSNGAYTLNFSTLNIPTQGIVETYTISIFANKTNFQETASFITITVHPIQTSIGVNNSVFVVDTGKVVDIKINYSVDGSEELIVGANCSVDWPSLYSLMSDTQGFVLRLYTTDLFIDTYTAIIKLEKPGYETAYKSITVIINRINIQVNTMNFQDIIETFSGETIMIKINLTEPGTEVYIENATIFYSWEFGFGYFDYVNNGIYELELNLPENIIGNYKITLIISKEASIYKQTEFSFNIAITEHELPNYMMWYIVYGLLGVIGVFGIIGLRTFVFLPRKRRKESELLANTQRYKDVTNIEALFISQRESGLYLYSKDYYYITEEDQSELLTGFIHAITLLSTRVAGKEELKEMAIISKDYKSIEKIIELDFKHFNFFISDYKDLRITFILKDKASERFKNQTAQLLSEIDSQFSERLEKWDGELEGFRKILPPLLDQYLQLYYRDLFNLNKIKYINRVQKEEKLSKMELRLLNVIISMIKEKKDFYLEDAIKSIHEKNKDKVIEGLESLIQRKIVIPSELPYEP